MQRANVFDRQLKKNFLYNTFYQLVTLLSPILISPYLARVIGPTGIGQFNYTYAIATYFAMVCNLGIGTYGNRECAVCRDDKERLSKTFWGIFIVQLLSSVCSIAASAAYLICFAKQYQLLLAIQMLMVLGAAADVTWFFFGLEQFQKVVVRNVVIKLLVLSTIFIFVKTEEDIWKYCLCMAGSVLLSQISLWPFLFKYLQRVEISWDDVKKHVKPALYLFIPVIGLNIYASVDKLMLENMVSVQSVGYYANAEGMCKLPYGIVTALTTVMLPRISHLMATKDDSTRKKEGEDAFCTTLRVTMMLAFPICMGLAAIAPEMVPWYYTTEFLPCIDLIKELSVLVLFSAWTNAIQAHYIIPLKKDNVLIRSSVVATMFNIIANSFLIVRFGVNGAVYGTLLTEAVVMGYKTWSVRKEFSLWRALKEVVPYGIMSWMMYVCVRMAGERLIVPTIKTTLVEIICGVICYGLLLGVYLFGSRVIRGNGNK